MPNNQSQVAVAYAAVDFFGQTIYRIKPNRKGATFVGDDTSA
jgi:hypothetical protein